MRELLARVAAVVLWTLIVVRVVALLAMLILAWVQTRFYE